MEKLEIARRQLGMATHLYIENLDPVSITILAGNAREIIDRLADEEGKETFRDDALIGNPGLSERDYYGAANLYRNAFKHLDRLEDQELIESFDDGHNKALLLVSWYTYGNLTGCTPIEAQCFALWFYAHEGEHLSSSPVVQTGKRFFGDMSELTTVQLKHRLIDAIKHFRLRSDAMTDERTEKSPLVYKND